MQRTFGELSIPRIAFGAFVVAAGVLLLLQNFDLVWVGPLWKWWPLVFIVVGTARFLQATTSDDRDSGAWFIFLGFWLLISFHHWFGLSFRTSWPILLIGVGTGMVWKAARGRSTIHV